MISLLRMNIIIVLAIEIMEIVSALQQPLKNNALADYEERMKYLLDAQPIIDTHNDLPMLFRYIWHNELYNKSDLPIETGLDTQTDIPRLRQGGVGAQFWSIYLDCKNDGSTLDEINRPSTIVRDTLEQIDVVKRLAGFYPDVFQMSYTPDEARSVFSQAKIASMMGVEGLHMVDSSIAMLRALHELGVRYVTLTHNCNNPFATAATNVANGAVDNGLTSAGARAVKEMNRLGLMVDLSHVSKQTMHDVLDITEAPVIFSHSSAFSLTPHPRNVPDDVLVRVAKNGGVVQVNFFPEFIRQGDADNMATIEDVADHVEHIAHVAGWDCVGLGSDFDGIPSGPVGLEDVSKYPELVKLLMKRGATDKQLAGLMGGNILRVWGNVEVVARGITSLPEEREWHGRPST